MKNASVRKKTNGKILITEKDKIQMTARSSKEFKYGEIWKSVNKCVFCDLNEKYTLDEINNVVLTTNVYPYIDGSLMIIPKRHILSLKEMNKNEWETVRMLYYIGKKFLRLAFGYKSVFIIYREGGSLGDESQKTVEHLHIHLVPYIKGLIDFNYQEAKYPPRIVAQLYKKNLNEMNKLKERYLQKYSK